MLLRERGRLKQKTSFYCLKAEGVLKTTKFEHTYFMDGPYSNLSFVGSQFTSLNFLFLYVDLIFKQKRMHLFE